MKHRKEIMAAVLGLLVLLYAGDWLLRNAIQGPLESERTLIGRYETTIENRKKQVRKLREDALQIQRWCEQSLPSDAEVARSLYQAWLLELVVHVGLDSPQVKPGQPVTRRVNKQDLFTALSFDVQGRGTLQQLNKFLFEFYRADHLHLIRAVGITPVARTDELNLSFSIAALALPDADRTDRLCSLQSDRLVSDDPAYYDVILDRNLFGIGATPDALEHAVLTRVSYVDDRPEATFSLKTTDERFTVGEGESLQIGTFRAKVVQIDDADVIIESKGQRWLLTLGDRLTEAFALPPEF